MPNAQKVKKVEEITKKLTEAKSAALVQYQGLTALQVSDLRDKVKVAGGYIEVNKNSLITRALENLGIKLPELLTGPTAIAYGITDEVAGFKEIDKINKEKKLTSFKYGIFDKKLLSLAEFTQFLTLPSKSALIAQFVGGLQNPLARLVGAYRFTTSQFVATLKAVADKHPASN